MFSVSTTSVTAGLRQHFRLSTAPTYPFSLLCFLVFYLTTAALAHGATPFPHFPAIQNNVRFWEDIYATYSTSQAVVHDSHDLSIVYEVIPIFNHRLPGSSKINRPVFKGIKNKYKNSLHHLAKGSPPRNTEEKRILALFGNAGSKRLKKAAASVRIQIGQKDRFLEGVIRSGSYIQRIKRIFRKKGLPEDLAYLPHVESSFNLRAYSKFGASGIWQFTRSTGKQFLTINYEVDERQDPILASYAAATFLKQNYDSLKSWPLAITAYNYGPAGMQRAKTAHGSYENIFKYYAKGHFKFASRNFYSEFLAAVNVAKRLEQDPNVQRNSPQKTLSVTLPAYIAAKDICAHFGLTVTELKKLNPALRQPVFQGRKYIPKGYTLHLPNTKRHHNLLATVPAKAYHNKQKPTQFYRVRKGDTAGGIAQKFNISLNSLRKANSLNKNATIFVGQNLRIPGQGHTHSQKSSTTAKKQPTKSKPAATTGSIPLLSDTKKSTTTWKKIQTARSVVLGELGVRKITNSGPSRYGTITVQPEESVELLADWLAVEPDVIRKFNGFKKGRVLHPDESIRIPLRNVAIKEFEEKRFDFHLETEEDFFGVYKIVGVQTYTVQKGDTVWDLCRNKFDLPLWLLKKYNTTLDFSALKSSQQLTIPIVKTI